MCSVGGSLCFYVAIATCRLQPPYADWTPIEFGSEDDNDHTAKLVLTGLVPAKTYTYQLKLGGATHDGEFRTAPTADGKRCCTLRALKCSKFHVQFDSGAVLGTAY